MTNSAINKIAIVGGGAFGTAIANIAAIAGRKTILWARDDATVDAINTQNQNPSRLPGVKLHEALYATSNLSTTIKDADAIILAIPAQQTASILEQLTDRPCQNLPVICLAKGIDRTTGALMSDLVTRHMPSALPVALSGPSFAKDIAHGLPTAVTVACTNQKIAQALCDALATPSFRLYFSTDLVGVQIGGALKNVIAIACGIVIGKGLGNSAASALATRGFTELRRLGTAMGAESDTLMGLSGLGDLMLCCSSTQSRNFAFGLSLGQNQQKPGSMAPEQELVEGVYTAKIAAKLAADYNIELPITSLVAQLLDNELNVDDALRSLMSRPIKAETL